MRIIDLSSVLCSSDLIVVHDDAHGVVGATLPVATPRGLALLGLAKHARATLRGRHGLAETIHVEDIVYQPQASRCLPYMADLSGGADGEAMRLGRRPASAAAAYPAPRGCSPGSHRRTGVEGTSG